MTEFQEVFNLFERKGYSFSLSDRGVFSIKKGCEKRTEAVFSEAFDMLDISYEGGCQRFLSDVKEHIKTEQESSSKIEVHAGLEYGNLYKVINSALFERLTTLGAYHDSVYGNFRFAITQTGSTVLLIKIPGCREWRTLPLSLKNSNLGSIGGICSQIDVGDISLSDAIENNLEILIKKASEELRSAQHNGLSSVQAKIALEYLPHCICAINGVKLLTHKVGKKKNAMEVVDGYGTGVDTALMLFDHSLWWLLGRKEMFMPLPANISNSPDVDCLHYIDLDEIRSHKGGPCPTWEKYLLRYTKDEARVFKAWIFGIFDARNAGRQMLYLYDLGQSGKSAVIKAISSVLGSGLVAAAQKDTFKNQFGVAKVWDKRLITIGDNKNDFLIVSQFMHSVLGGDMMEVEHKGRDSFSATLKCKVLAAGNTPPSVDLSADNETSRIIILKPCLTEEQMEAEGILKRDENGEVVRLPSGRPQNIGDPNFCTNLCNEFKAFLASCEDTYKELCPSGENISLPKSVWDNLIEAQADTESMYEEVIESKLEYTGDKDDFISLSDMQTLFIEATSREERFSGLNYKDFKAHLQRKFGHVLGKVHGNRAVFKGLKIKEGEDAWQSDTF